MCYAQCCHGNGNGVRHVQYKVSWPFALLLGYCVGNSLKLCNLYCCHGDGSDGRHVCSKYHGHMHYYQATMLPETICCCHFVVMVVMGGMCVQSITAIRSNSE